MIVIIKQYSRIRFVAYIVILLMLPTAAYASSLGDNNGEAHCNFIFTLTQQIANGRDEDMRVDLTKDLAIYVGFYPECGKDHRIVDEIAELLGDSNEGVEAMAAQALAAIGPPANKAVPALIRALNRYQKKMQSYGGVILPSVSAGDSFRNAIKSITGKPYPDEAQE